MLKTITIAALLAATSAVACDDDHVRAQRDNTRAIERQNDTLRQMERNQREQNLMLDRQRRIDQRDRR